MRASLLVLVVSLVGPTACEYTTRIEGKGASRDAYSAMGSDSENEPSSAGDVSDPPRPAIDRWKELLIVDPIVLESEQAENEMSGGAFSFRSRMEELAAQPSDAPRMTEAWLASWETVNAVGRMEAPVVPRPAVRELLLEPWSKRGLSMSSAPFRLIAIVNRLDLYNEQEPCGDGAGELRFVYTAVDPRNARALAMTVIVEVPFPKSRTAHEWAEQWHRLSSLSFDDAYVATLTGLVLDVTRHADPNSIRLRTNEVALGAPARLPWELREFVREADAYGRINLAPRLLRATPRDGMDGTSVLEALLKDQEPELKVGRVVDLPLNLQAGASSMGDRFVRWGRSAPITESARRTFSMGTCNGCHAGERDAFDRLQFQHLAPSDLPAEYYASAPMQGGTLVSTFLHDPEGGDDELGRREAAIAALLSSTCTPTAERPSHAAEGYSLSRLERPCR